MSNESKISVQKFNIPDDIVQLATAVFTDSAKAELWLNTPIHALNGDTPITRINTDEGVKEIITIYLKN